MSVPENSRPFDRSRCTVQNNTIAEKEISPWRKSKVSPARHSDTLRCAYKGLNKARYLENYLSVTDRRGRQLVNKNNIFMLLNRSM